MTTITIRHVPDEVRNELAARAARSGQSLQEYMLGELSRLAARMPIADVLADVRARKRRSGRRVEREEIVSDRDADRR